MTINIYKHRIPKYTQKGKHEYFPRTFSEGHFFSWQPYISNSFSQHFTFPYFNFCYDHCITFNLYDFNFHLLRAIWASQVALVVKNSRANAADLRDKGSIYGLGRAPEGEHDNPPQYSCLENPMDRGAWWATVQRVTE